MSTFTEVTRQPIPYQFATRRVGDIANCYASADETKRLFDWEAKLSITEMCQDTWH